MLGGVEAGKFRNCLIFPRKGCKKSLETYYRILFLNSSFIDLFFKRQLTGCSNSSFLNDYYVVCPPQSSNVLSINLAPVLISMQCSSKKSSDDRKITHVSQKLLEGAGCPHQKSNCHMSTESQIFCTCYYDF